ncbi:hypothetical protein FKP32DRAFT_1675575 [Trametes sanguinea]|nr:hypothetical protein FKP32DRAFT_1675575 [Trametes sanguinea]
MSNLANHAQKKRKVADGDAVSVHSEASSSSSHSEWASSLPPVNATAPKTTEDAMARLQERQRRALEIYNSMKRTFAEITQPTGFAAGASPIAARPSHDNLSSGGVYRSPTGAERTQAAIGQPATNAPSLPPPSAETATS